MRSRLIAGAMLLPLALSATAALSDPPAAIPSIEAFARAPRLASVAISPDGRYLAWIQGIGELQSAMVLERATATTPNPAVKVVMSADSDPFRLRWCAWANDDRLLCGLHAMDSDAGLIYPVTRLAAVNADGTKMKVLVQNTSAGVSQFQDNILDMTPAEPKSVLVSVDDDRDTFPSVFELNVYTGQMGQRVGQHEPIRNFISDKHGHIRIGTGFSGTKYTYYARLESDKTWRQLAKFEAFDADRTPVYTPIAIGHEPNTVYAWGAIEGRDALYELDLTDKEPPRLVFAHPQVDVGDALFEKDGRMIGVFYETDRQYVYYTDPRAQEVMTAINKSLPGRYNTIEDTTQAEDVYVIRSASDVDGGTYYVFEADKARLVKLGSAYVDLDPNVLGHMRSIAYPARDGVSIPGYLTVPPGKRAEHLPLIVMPHGGPRARDSWEYFFLQQFLVTRGYAILQMNFRGSEGYGSEWFWSAHQDWGGVTYEDIVDGARWAVAQGIADPRRMCIVGWSFGGYAALLGAARNGDLFRCSVSIAGVSDLVELERDDDYFVGGEIARRQIGTDRAKLREDSPRRHAENVTMPILMIHGDRDYQVQVDQSKIMAKALEKARKPYEFVLIKGASHQMERPSDRVKLLTEVEKFLLAQIGPGVAAEAKP